MPIELLVPLLLWRSRGELKWGGDNYLDRSYLRCFPFRWNHARGNCQINEVGDANFPFVNGCCYFTIIGSVSTEKKNRNPPPRIELEPFPCKSLSLATTLPR